MAYRLVLVCIPVLGDLNNLFPQILVIIGLTHALVVFRVIAAVQLAEGSWEFMTTHANSIAMMLGAVLHYLIITVMTRVQKVLNESLSPFS